MAVAAVELAPLQLTCLCLFVYKPPAGCSSRLQLLVCLLKHAPSADPGLPPSPMDLGSKGEAELRSKGEAELGSV